MYVQLDGREVTYLVSRLATKSNLLHDDGLVFLDLYHALDYRSKFRMRAIVIDVC